MSTSQVVVALLAVVVGALLKSISGVGMPLVTIPAIAYVADVETAIGFTAVPNFLQNVALAFRERASIRETRNLAVLSVTTFIGAVIGTLVLVSIPQEPIIAVLVAVAVIYAVTFFAKPDFGVEPQNGRRLSPLVGTAAGMLQGAVGISAPIVVSWVHAHRLPRGAHILSVTTMFGAAGLAQIPTLAVSDQMTGLWIIAAVACIPTLAVIPFGSSLRARLSSEGFDRFVVLILLTAMIGLAIRTFT